jgi:hypothetical protein
MKRQFVIRRSIQRSIQHMVLAAWALGCAAAWAGKAHDHGVARLDVALDAGRVEINLEISLHDLTGFERAPRTEAERAAVAAVLAKLNAAGDLFRFDGTTCTSTKTELRAPVWQVGPSAPAAAKDEHADLEASYEFRCAAGPGALDAMLFQALPRLQRIEVQAVTARGQMKFTLRRPKTRLAFAR